MKYTTLAAFRFLFSRCKDSTVTLFSSLSIIGIAVSVMTLIIVISVMNGFERDLKEKVIGFNAHLTITDMTGPLQNWKKIKDLVSTVKGVKAVSPYTAGEVMARYNNRIYGLFIRGIVPEYERKVSTVLDSIVRGSSKLDSEKSIILGNEFARQAGVAVGDEIVLVSPTDVYTPFGRAPRVVKLTVTGIFKTGMSDYDMGAALVPMALVQRLYSLGKGVHGLSVMVDDPDLAYVMKGPISAVLPKNKHIFGIKTWMERNLTLFRAVRTEKKVMFLILVLAVGVAAINIVSSLIMLVMSKTKEIGIFRALGMTRGAVMAVFFKAAVLLGSLGTVLGLLAGVAFVQNINMISGIVARFTGFELFPKDIYYFDVIPVQMQLADIVLICGCAVVLSVAAGLYPSWKASRLDPASILRYQ